MTSFQTKISWKRRTKGENKNYRFVPFRSFPTGNRKLKKNSKNSKIPLRIHFMPNQVGQGRIKERK